MAVTGYAPPSYAKSTPSTMAPAPMFAPMGAALNYNPNIGTQNQALLQMQARKMAMENAKKTQQRSQAGQAIGTAVGGPIGGLIGGALGGMIGSSKGKVRNFQRAASLGLDPSNPHAQDLAGFMMGMNKPAVTGRVLGGGSRNSTIQASLDAAHAQSYQQALDAYNQYSMSMGRQGAQGFGAQYAASGGQPQMTNQMFAPMANAAGPEQAGRTGLGWAPLNTNPFTQLMQKLQQQRLG